MQKGYSTDLTDREWFVIYRYFSRTKKQGRPQEHLKRALTRSCMFCAQDVLGSCFQTRGLKSNGRVEQTGGWPRYAATFSCMLGNHLTLQR
jgi:hypothetical protein